MRRLFAKCSVMITALGLLLPCFPILGLAQDRGSITGTVTDSTGAIVPGVDIIAKNTGTAVTHAAKTSEDGTYTLVYLPVGIYTVTAAKDGFRRSEATIVVNVNTTVRLDVKLEVGEVAETVEVTTEAPLVQMDTSDLGKVVPTKAILDLPLFLGGGIRSSLSFVMLTPGVTGDPGNPRIGGGLLDGQSKLLDGAESSSERRNDPGFTAVSSEAIEEFKVNSSGYSAEYGRTSNGVINFVTKSGTNELRGSVYTFVRNDVLNARQFTFGPGTRQRSRQVLGGVAVGGPVLIPKIYDGHNKAFFFFAYERSKFRGGNPSNLISLPLNEFRNGDFRRYTDAAGNTIPLYDPIDANGRLILDPFARPRLQCNGMLNVLCPERIDPIAKIVQARIAQPDDPTKAFDNTRAVDNPGTDANVYSVKLDYVFSERNRISGLASRSYNTGITPVGPVPGAAPNRWNSRSTLKFYRLNHDYILRRNLLNHFTFGHNRRDIIENANNVRDETYRAATQIKGATGSKTGKPTEYDTEFGNFGVGVDTMSPGRTYTVNEQMAWIKGRHSLKFGFEYLLAKYRRFDCNWCSGVVSFSAAATGNPGVNGRTGSNYAAFLLGLASGGNFNYSADIEFSTPYYAWYVQDDFRLSRKLTMNAGLRYDLPIPKKETNCKNSNFNPALPNPLAGGLPGAMEFACSGPGRSGKERFGETRKNAFGPRLGFAYEVDSRTVVRAGGSIYYQPSREDGNADNGIQGFGGRFGAVTDFLASGISYRVNNGFTEFGSLVEQSRPPKIDPAILNFGTPFYYFSKAGRAPYFMDWNFTVERSVTKSSVFRMSYHATIGNKLLSRKQSINQLDPKYWAVYGDNLGRRLDDPRVIATGFKPPYDGYPLSRSLQQALRPFPQFNGVDINAGGMNDGHMTYHALEASFERRFSSGVFVLGSYTFSKLISNTDGEDANRGDGGGQNQYNRKWDKAVGIQDQPHNLVLSYIYELPFGGGRRFLGRMPRVANWVLGNWRISAVHRYASGGAIAVTSGQNLFGAGNARPNVVPGEPLKNPQFDPKHPEKYPYVNRAAFQRPANMEYGNAPRRNARLRAPGLLSEDVAILKDFGSEKRHVEFRASAFNIANRHILGGLSGNVTNNIDSSTFGMITNPQTNRPREIQFGLKLYF